MRCNRIQARLAHPLRYSKNGTRQKATAGLKAESQRAGPPRSKCRPKSSGRPQQRQQMQQQQEEETNPFQPIASRKRCRARRKRTRRVARICAFGFGERDCNANGCK
jgi:hypothetical protein